VRGARSFRGIVALLNGSGGAHDAATSLGCQRLRAAAAPLPHQRDPPPFTEILLSTAASVLPHLVRAHQSPTSDAAAAAAALYSVASTAMVFSAPI